MPVTKIYPKIDYSFRPTSYWAAESDPLEAALRNVKGRNRRDMIRKHYASGKLEALPDYLIADTLDEGARERLGKIHPSFMGGEYLPDYAVNEVEIARIELRSTTSDVISVRARPRGERIWYSVCDEYETAYAIPRKTSSRPFPLRELISFLDAVEQSGTTDPDWNRFGFVLSFNQSNLECGADLDSLRDFTRVESDYYPDLGVHYAKAIEEWHEARLAELAAETDNTVDAQ
jgi:hypothetical protein